MADFYVRAARALQDILAHRDSIKGATSEMANINDAKRLMALVVHTLAYREALQHVLAEIDLPKKESKWLGPKSSINRTKGSLLDPPLTQCLLLLLAHDLLLAPRGIQASKAWPPRVCIEKYKSQLHASLVKLQIRRKKRSVEELRSGEAGRKIAARIPRWCRINTLHNDEQAVLGQLKHAGFQLVDQPYLEKEYVFDLSS